MGEDLDRKAKALAVRPFVRWQIWVMLQLQFLLAVRSDEIVILGDTIARRIVGQESFLTRQ